MPQKKHKPVTDAVQILHRRYAHLKGWKKAVDEERGKAAIGELIRQSREALKLSQRELAKRVGTSQSAISRIEDADYDGLKIETLERIAAALELPLAIRLGKRSAQLQPATA